MKFLKSVLVWAIPLAIAILITGLFLLFARFALEAFARGN
jgi:hypothetical protein